MSIWELYLLTYSAVDNLDAMIAMCKVSFIINQSVFVTSLFYFDLLLTHISIQKDYLLFVEVLSPSNMPCMDL